MAHGSKRAEYEANPPTPPSQRDTRLFNRFRISAYFGVLAVFSILAILNNFKSMWAPPVAAQDTESYIARIVLLIVLILLAIRWVFATDKEFKLWAQVLENPVEKWDAYVAIVLLPLGLGFCLAYAFDLVKVSMAFTGFLLINYWSQWQSNDHFTHALPETRKKAKDAGRQGVLNVMEQYWLKRPQLARITTMMFFSSLAFSLAWAGSFEKQLLRHRFELSATIVLVVSIVLGEILIGIWRYQRNKGTALAEKLALPWKFSHKEEDLATAADEGDLKGLRTNAYVLIFWRSPRTKLCELYSVLGAGYFLYAECYILASHREVHLPSPSSDFVI